MAKNNNRKGWIIIAIIVLLFLFMGNKGLFVNTISGGNSGGSGSSGSGGSGGGGGGGSGGQNQLAISVLPKDPCKGDTVTGYITSNMPKASCIIQYRFTSLMVWQTLATVTLNANGKYNQNAPANNVGSITFRVVCGDVVSNEQIVTVKDCGNQYTCFDSDIDLDEFAVSGFCESSFDNLGYNDGCVGSEEYMREYYCDGGKCQWIPNTRWKCSQMACEQISPSGQPSCNLGNCVLGTCTYVPATLTIPARCGCQ